MIREVFSKSAFSMALLIGIAWSLPAAAAEDSHAELRELNQRVQEAGARDDYPLAERLMDELVDAMRTLGFPEGEIRKRAILRIRYSMSAGRWFAAREAAEAYVADHPADFEARSLWAGAALRMGRFNEARDALRPVYEDDPGGPAGRPYLRALRGLNDREAALAVCARMVETLPDDPSILAEAADTRLQFGEAEGALELLARLEAADPDHPALECATGMALREQGLWEEAAERFARVKPGNPRRLDALMALSLCHSQARRFEDAAETLLDALALNPFNEEAMMRLEQALARTRNREGAMAVRRIREGMDEISLPDGEANYLWRNGDMVESARLRSIALNRRGEFARAQRLLEETAKTVPDSTAAVENLARHHITTLRAGKAAALFDSLRKRLAGADRDRATLQWAMAMLRQDRPGPVIELLENAPPDGDLQRDLRGLIGTYHLEIKGEPARAVEYLRNVSEPEPDALAALGRAYALTGECGKALDCLNRLPGEFERPIPLLAKVECLARAGEIPSARGLYETIRQKHPNLGPLETAAAEAALAAAEIAPDREEKQQRAEWAKRRLADIQSLVIEANRLGWPDSVPVLTRLSDIFHEAGDAEEALLYARRAFEGKPGPETMAKLIQRMTQPDHVFERLYWIRRARAMDGMENAFGEELAACRAVLRLAPGEKRPVTTPGR